MDVQYLGRMIEQLQNEIMQLRAENQEIKLNMVCMNPIYSDEQRAMAAQQLRQMQDEREARDRLEQQFK